MLLTNSMSSIFLLVINYLFNRSINIGILEMLYNLIISGYNNLSCNHPTPFSLSNTYMTYSRYTCIQLCLNHSRFKLPVSCLTVFMAAVMTAADTILWGMYRTAVNIMGEAGAWHRREEVYQLMGMCDRRDIFPLYHCHLERINHPLMSIPHSRWISQSDFVSGYYLHLL